MRLHSLPVRCGSSSQPWRGHSEIKVPKAAPRRSRIKPCSLAVRQYGTSVLVGPLAPFLSIFFFPERTDGQTGEWAGGRLPSPHARAPALLSVTGLGRLSRKLPAVKSSKSLESSLSLSVSCSNALKHAAAEPSGLTGHGICRCRLPSPPRSPQSPT